MTWEVLKFCKTSFTRQLTEVILISHSKERAATSGGRFINMNRKEEYNRGLVPGLTDKDLSKEEKEQEEDLN